MKKILIIGCTEVTDVIVPLLCKDPASVSELNIASLDKAECDEYRKKYAGGPVRITTARMDVKNAAGSKMMLSITQPELIGTGPYGHETGTGDRSRLYRQRAL